MKNYYDQQQELQIALYRLEALKNKKEMYFNRTQPGTPDYTKEFVNGGVHKDAMTEYVIQIEKIDKEIEKLEDEIESLESYLKKMEKCLRNMKGVLEKIFVAKYIDNKPVSEITHLCHYSPTDVYRKLQIIKKMIEGGTEC